MNSFMQFSKKRYDGFWTCVIPFSVLYVFYSSITVWVCCSSVFFWPATQWLYAVVHFREMKFSLFFCFRFLFFQVYFSFNTVLVIISIFFLTLICFLSASAFSRLNAYLIFMIIRAFFSPMSFCFSSLLFL